MDLDLTADLFQDVTVNYGRGIGSDTVNVDVVGLADFLQELYAGDLHNKSDKEAAAALLPILREKGFANLPGPEVAVFAPHALAQRLIKLGVDHKKKFETALWGGGDAPQEWPVSTPASPG